MRQLLVVLILSAFLTICEFFFVLSHGLTLPFFYCFQVPRFGVIVAHLPHLVVRTSLTGVELVSLGNSVPKTMTFVSKSLRERVPLKQLLVIV